MKMRNVDGKANRFIARPFSLGRILVTEEALRRCGLDDITWAVNSHKESGRVSVVGEFSMLYESETGECLMELRTNAKRTRTTVSVYRSDE